MRTTTRTGQAPEQNFEEIGQDMASSVEVSVNAKGLFQYTLKLYFNSIDELLDPRAGAVARAAAFDEQFRAVFPTPNGG